MNLNIKNGYSIDVIRAEFLSKKEFFDFYVKKGKAVHIKGAINHWGAIDKWQGGEHLSSVLGEKNIQVRQYPMNDFSRDKMEFRWMTYKKFYEALHAEPRQYNYFLAQNDLVLAKRKAGPLYELTDDIDYTDYCGEKGSHFCTKVFLGKDTISDCHYHPAQEALLCQVVGDKRVLMFDSDARFFYQLHPEPWYKTTANWSQIRFEKDSIDTMRFPNFKNIGVTEIILEAGDALYIPIYCWHAAFGDEFSASITHFWHSSFEKKYLSRLGLRSNYMKPIFILYRWFQEMFGFRK